MNNDIALTESTYYILLSLYEPQHGYGIMQRTEQLSGGRVKLAAGTLYGALSSMTEDKGKEALEGELDRLKELVQNGETILGGENDG